MATINVGTGTGNGGNNGTANVKDFQMQAGLVGIVSAPFLMRVAGQLTALSSAGITTIQYKKNAGAFASAVFPITYAANDVLTFTWMYTDLNNLSGNLILIGTDN